MEKNAIVGAKIAGDRSAGADGASSGACNVGSFREGVPSLFGAESCVTAAPAHQPGASNDALFVTRPLILVIVPLIAVLV